MSGFVAGMLAFLISLMADFMYIFEGIESITRTMNAGRVFSCGTMKLEIFGLTWLDVLHFLD